MMVRGDWRYYGNNGLPPSRLRAIAVALLVAVGVAGLLVLLVLALVETG
jgi:hypothetical protein